MEDDEKYLKLIESLFLKMGAPEKQARTMSSQLLKRARQIADQREITLVRAVENLLEQVVKGRKS